MQYGDGLFKAYVPWHCYGNALDLSRELATLDAKIKKEIPFVWSGVEVWNVDIKKSDIPVLPSGRKFILWDNYVSTDSSDVSTLMVDPPELREEEMIDNLQEYWLNLAFPAYRVVPAIASFSQLMKKGVANYSYYWRDNMKIYSDFDKINSVLMYAGEIWCNYFAINCSQIQVNSYYELLKGLNYIEFDQNNIQIGILDPRIFDLAEEVFKRK